MKSLIRNVYLLGLIVIFSVGCSLKGKVSKIRGADDFLNTEIIASDVAVADGTDELVVAVHLKNSDNSAVEFYKPEYDIVSGSGVAKGPCTTSTSSGISVCILKSTVPGSKRLRLINAKAGLEKDVLFAERGTASLNGLASASGAHSVTNGGYKVSNALGAWVGGKPVTTNSGYKVYLSVQGAMDSREVQ